MQNDQPEGEDEYAFSGLPDNMQSLVAEIGFLDTANLPDEINTVIAPMLQGLCMTCSGPLGDDAAFIINSKGICAAYCAGPCMQDMAVLGWLQEQHDDIRDAIEFRGGNSDGISEGT